MNILQMKYFLTAAACLNFTQAANLLYISQPALSRQISTIEEELEVTLFLRSNRSVELTDSGKFLRDELQKMYDFYMRSIAKAKNIEKGISGELNIGILDGTSVSDLFPWVMDVLGEAFPTVDLKLHYHSFNALAAGLYDGSLDLALTLLFDVKNRDNLKFRVIEKSKDHIVVHRDHPLAAKDYVHLSDLKNETFIMVAMSDSERSATLILDGCQKQGFLPKVKFSPSIQTSMLWVQAGVGVTMLDSRNMLRKYPDIKFLEVDQVSDPSLTAAWHQNNLNPIISIFVDMLIASAQKRYMDFGVEADSK